MCANPAVSTDNHAASDNCARSDPTARSYLCSGLDHSQRSDVGRRIDERPIRHNCGRVNTWGRRWRRIEQCSSACPSSVWFARYDRHRCRWHSRCHIGMHDHSTGQRLIQCRSVTPIVQKTYFIRASRLQRSHTFEEQFAFIRNPACRPRDNCKWIWPTSAKEPCVAQVRFDHPVPR